MNGRGRRQKPSLRWLVLVLFFLLAFLLPYYLLTSFCPRPAKDAKDADTPLHQPPHDGFGEKRDEFLGGLLANETKADSCTSRYEMAKYRHPSPYKPSSYLVKKLRDYEETHRRCKPSSHAYREAIPSLSRASSSSSSSADCKYLLYRPFSGVGNKIVTLVSSFLYALLTGRVLLVDPSVHFSQLFCEPFPGSSWLIPEDFPLKNLQLSRTDPSAYGYLVKNEGKRSFLPSFVYLHLVSDYEEEDARFFFEEDQRALENVPWLLVRSDIYFAAGLFLNEGFQPELFKMFPETAATFHHLSRYLLHPSNKAWEVITRYYETYLSAGKETLGIQIRVFDEKASPFETVKKQVVDCIVKEKLLPEIKRSGYRRDLRASTRKIWNVVVTSLYSGYAEAIRDLYWERGTESGELVSVHQPSREEKQLLEDPLHDVKAWAEMNLLSFSDVLMTSAWSTFGYVGQGLGALRPWIIPRTDLSCFRDVSMEPCFHNPPASLIAKKMVGWKEKAAGCVGYCFDAEGGIKVYDRERQ